MDKLSKHVEIKPGFAFKSEEFVEDTNEIPLVKGENVHQGYIDWNASKYWSSEKTHNLEEYFLVENDIVVAMDRPWVTAGLKWSYIKKGDPKSLLVQRVARLRAKGQLSQSYLRYLIGSEYFANYIQPIVTGVNVPHISAKQIGDFKIPIPEPNIQRKIAAILSAYDDLIENNNKRIGLLEKAAEEIYREWFVRMRFPGWEQVKFVKGIPADWEVIRVADAFEFLGGGTPSTTEKRYWDNGTVNWFTPSDITKANGIFLPESIDKCTEEGLNNSSARMFPAYSVMMTSRATIGAIGINTTPACTNQGFITCIPNENFPLTFMYHWLKLNKPHFELLATGATFAELTKGTFKKIKIIKPEKTLVEQYDEKVAPMFKEMESLLQKVVLLKQSRDLLLSRLISGKLSVEALDIRFPPSMIAQ